MLKSLVRSFLMVLWMTILLGIVYPMLVTVIATFVMPGKAGGSFVVIEEKIVGSKLIAQPFSQNHYFWPRPSATSYQSLPSGGSNLGPTSSVLRKQVKERQEYISKAHDNVDFSMIPSELVYASGSGLDPHIKTGTAFFQFSRVAEARKMNEEEKQNLRKLILKYSHSHYFRFLGPSNVNVLELNIALDELKPMS